MIALILVCLTAEPPSSALEKADAALQKADFVGALATLDAMDRPAATEAQLSKAALLRAECHFALGKQDAARVALSDALDHDSHATLDPKVSGKALVELLEETRRARLAHLSVDADSIGTATIDEALNGPLPLAAELDPGAH